MKKLVIFLMIAIPLLIVLIVNFTVDVVIGDVYIAVERIELDRTSIIANVDERTTIKYAIYPENATNKDIVWSSDNEDVAMVDENGNVSFVGFGNGYITATTADGNKRASCYFYVTDTRVHQVILSAPSNEVNVGKTLQLSATILPAEATNKNITFSSSNPLIATVDSNGLVYGLASGNVTISATSEDGSFVDSVLLAVTIPVSGLDVKEEQVVLSRTYYQIEYSLLPQNASNRNVHFVSSDTSIATVDNYGLVNFKKAGTVTVELTTADGGFTDSISITSTDGYAHELIIETTTLEMEVGQSFVIDYTVYPSEIYNTSVTFSSDNSEIAYVDESGYIHAEKGGNTIINVSVEKAPGRSITKQIYLYVSSPATGIIIDDIITAENTLVLSPVSYPQDSTNTNFYFHSDNPEVLTVNEFGEVTINSAEPRAVSVLIYANEDYSEVSKRVNILYTAQMAYSFTVLSDTINLEYGQIKTIDYQIMPANASATNVKVEVCENFCDNEVVQVQSDGSLLGIGGGECRIKISLSLYDGSLSQWYCDVIVSRPATSVEIDLDLEQIDGQYVTASNTVALQGYVYPQDATNQNIIWSVSDRNIAVITNNSLMFNQAGEVILYAQVDDVITQVIVYYTGSYPMSAELGVQIGEQILPLPTQFNVGDSYKIVILSVFPSNTSNKNLSLQVTNQTTQSPTGQVLELEGDVLTAVNGGRATLIANISSTVQMSFEIDVVRRPETIEVSPAGIKTSDVEVELNINVLPVDTTNKDVIISVSDPLIASVENNILKFNQNGIVTVTVVSKADANIKTEFTIEKIEKEAIILSTSAESTTLLIGDLAYFGLSEIETEYDEINIAIISQNPSEGYSQVIEKQIDMIRVIGLGSATVELQLLKDNQIIERYEHAISVIQYVEDIEFTSGIDFYNDEFVTARDVLNLNFTVYPEYATISELNYEITQSYSSQGINEAIAYINAGNIYFIKAGVIMLTVTSQDDGKFSKNFRIRYTGGDAVAAQINVTSPVNLSIGESITIEVLSWIPSNVVNDIMLIREVTHTANVAVIAIDGNRITALNGGISRLIIELSNGITKDITINVLKLVTDIQVSEEEILTIDSTVTVDAIALPSSATNRTLKYELKENSIAYLEGNTVIFNGAGSVTLVISSTDGSNIVKEVQITSTLGYVSTINLNTSSKTINKNESFDLYVLSTLPSGAAVEKFYYEIISMTTNDGTLNVVATVSENGHISALYGGEAVVRVYTYDYYGNKVYADCVITVYSAVTSVDVTFDKPLEQYQNQNSFITAQSEIAFNEIAYPLDSTIKSFHYEISDSSIASVENGKIIFKNKGRVNIKFISDDSSKGEKSKTISIYYTAGDLITADIDRTNIQNNTIYLSAGDEFDFIAQNYMPYDCDELNYIFSSITEQRIDSSKSIGYFSDNTFIAQHGGSMTFDLIINNYSIGQFTIVVAVDAEYIFVEGGSEIVISSPGYSIIAQAMPSDTYQTELIFTSGNPQIASVGVDGSVEFYSLGKVSFTISIKDNPSISISITIEYTKEVQAVAFSDTREEMYTGEYVEFDVNLIPADADYQIEVSLSDPSKADLIDQRSNPLASKDWRLIGKTAGEVSVIARVVGTDITATKTFVFYAKISDIQLKLDKVDDKVGLGQYRVFGTNSFDENMQTTNLYQMQYTITPSNDYANLLEWTSSDEEVATVDQNGLVTILTAGEVRITVRQIAPYSGAYVASDYYDFTFVNGINVYSFEEYLNTDIALNEINQGIVTNLAGIVLQNNIQYDNTLSTSEIILNYNLYGNGYMFDLSQSTCYSKMTIVRNNIIIDNITLRGATLSSNASLSDLDGNGQVITVQPNVTDALIYNSIIENGEFGIRLFSSSATVKGCIVRNTMLASIVLTRLKNYSVASELIVEDCAFSNSLLCGIMFDIDDSDVPGQVQNKLTLRGDVYFYNWSTIEEMAAGMRANLEKLLSLAGLTNMVDTLVNQFKSRMQSYSDYKYIYNGSEYYNFAVLNFDISAIGYHFDSGDGIIYRNELNGNCNYAPITVDGTITAGVANCDYTIGLLTLPASAPFIRPGDTYEGNQYVMAILRQPSLF